MSPYIPSEPVQKAIKEVLDREEKKEVGLLASYRIGTDIGGTFTDVVVIAAGGCVIIRKVLSVTEDYTQGIAVALKALLLP